MRCILNLEEWWIVIHLTPKDLCLSTMMQNFRHFFLEKQIVYTHDVKRWKHKEEHVLWFFFFFGSLKSMSFDCNVEITLQIEIKNHPGFYGIRIPNCKDNIFLSKQWKQRKPGITNKPDMPTIEKIREEVENFLTFSLFSELRFY